MDRTWRFELSVEAFPNILERVRGTPPRAAALVVGYSEDSLGVRTDGWSAKEHLAHLDDLHALDVKRLEEFTEGAEVLSAADMSNARTEAAHHNESPIEQILQRLSRHRAELVSKLDALGEDVILRRSRHARLGRALRLLDWLYFVAEHDDHHLVRARLALSRIDRAGS